MDNEKTPAPEPLDGQPEPAEQETSEQGQPLQFPDDAVNLVPYLFEAGKSDPKVLKFIQEELGERVYADFEEDWNARDNWIEKRRLRMKLFLGDLEEKREPFKNCANLHEPILLERLLRLTHRVYAELLPQNAPIWEAIPSADLAQDRADIITQHDNWQFTKDIPDFKQQLRRALQEFFRDGDCVIHSYFDSDLGKNRHEYLSPEEFVYPYTWKTVLADMSDVPRKTRIWRHYKRKLLALADAGDYDHEQVERVFAHADQGSNEDRVSHPLKDLMDKYEGKDRTDNVSDAPYMVLEQHTYVTFPGDDRETPVRVVMEYDSKIVLAVYKREFDDPADLGRFSKQTAEFQQYTQDVQKFQQASQLEAQLLDRLRQPDVDPEEGLMVAQQTRLQAPPPPVPPPWMQFDESGMPKPPERCKQKVIEQFSHATCIENPDGSHGLGIGALLMPHQQASNILLNQFVDAGTIANSNTFIMHEAVKLPPGVTSISPNTVTRVRGLPFDAMDKAITKIPVNPPNPQLLQAVQMQQRAADGIANAPDVLSGEKDGPETFRGQATRVEQAVKQLTVFAANFVEMLTNVAKNNAMLNFFHLPDYKLVSVLDPQNRQMQNIEVSRDLYRDDYTIMFTADLRFASKAQRIAEQDDVLGMLTKGIPPQIASIIFDGPQIFAEAVRQCLEARGQYGLVKYVLGDAAIAQKIQQQQVQAQGPMPPQGGPPAGGPHPPGMPQPGHPMAPSVPSGQPNTAPGAQPPPKRIPVGVPVEAAPGQ